MKNNYSVIIRTKNSGLTIKTCLDSLLHQSIPPEEIIIVDSGSKDDTLSIVNQYKVKLIYYPLNIPFNYSKALNLGIKEVKTDYVLILSSHVELINSHTVFWMHQVLEDNNKCIAVSAYRTNIKNENQFKSLQHIRRKLIDIKNFRGRAMFNFCSIIRKVSWDLYQFNEEIPNCEDQDWSYNFIKKGFFTEMISDPNVYYNNPYYNQKKDIFDTITIGRTVYPYFVSKKYMLKNFKLSAKSMIKGNMSLAKYYILLCSSIFKYKYLGLYNKKSIYNKKLN